MPRQKNEMYVCVKTEGCRLSDMNLSLVNGQKFSRTKEEVETSRSFQAALKAGWIKDISEGE